MPDISKILLKFSNTFQSLPQPKKITLLLVLLLIIAGPIGLFSWLNKPHYQILYTRLSPEDAGAIIDKLKEEEVPYRLKQGGATILVPEEKVHELRLQLATERVLQKGVIGFELFDQTNLGTTEFVQTINYQRAIQGELSRTISSLAEIEWARVHLAIPQKSLFIEEEQSPTASILIKLRPGTYLRKEQVAGIVHLVSCSIEGLSPENIRIVDDQGRILSPNPNDYSDQLLQIAKMEYQTKLEESLEEKITGMLGKALGENKVISRVSVALNLKRLESTEEKYDPDRTVVKTEQRVQEAAKGQTPLTPGAGDNASYQKSDEITKYELTKATHHIIELPGQITRLSAAVLVDGRYERVGKDTKYVPRTPEEMEGIRTIVEKAVGYDPARGDQIEVVSIPFHRDGPDRPKAGLNEIPNWQFWLSLIKYGVKILFLLIVLFFLFRPLLKWLYQFTPSAPQEGKALPLEEGAAAELGDSPESIVERIQGNLPERVSNLEIAIKSAASEESRELEQLVKAMREIAKQEPKRIAQLTHEWLQEERTQS